MTETERKALADRLRSKDGTLAGLIEAALKAADTIETQAREIARLRDVLGRVLTESVDIECGDRIIYAGTVKEIRAALEAKA